MFNNIPKKNQYQHLNLSNTTGTQVPLKSILKSHRIHRNLRKFSK